MGPVWDRYFFEVYPARPLAYLRFYFGVLLFIFYVQIGHDLPILLMPEGFSRWQPGLLPVDSRAYWAVYFVAVLVSLFVAAGLFTRTSLILLLVAHTQLVQFNADAFWGWSHMIKHFLIFLFLADAGKTWSLDTRLGLRPEIREASAWQYRLWHWQLMLIYAVVVLWRWPAAEWWRGDVLEATLRDSVFSRASFLDLSEYSGILNFVSRAGFGLEMLGATLPFWPLRIRRGLIVGLVGFHVVTLLLTTVQIWQQVMIGALLICWVGGEGRKTEKRLATVPWIFAGFFILAFLTAIPNHFLSQRQERVQKAALRPLIWVQLGWTSNMKLFHSGPKLGRHCIYVVSYQGRGQSTLVYNNSDYCFSNTFRFSEDEVFTAIWRLSVKNDSAKRRLGRHFCRKTDGHAEEVGVIHVAERPGVLEGTEISPHARLLFRFNCKNGQIATSEHPEFLDAIYRDHSQIL